MTQVDHDLFTWLNAWMVGGRTFWTLWTASWLGFALAGALLVSAIWTKRPVAALAAFLAFAVTDPTCSYVLKPMFGRDRPCQAMTGVNVPATPKGEPVCGSGKSMPSNHAANTMAVAVAANNPLLVFLSLLVGLSRIVTGQHWPTDVAAGWTLGAGVGIAVRTAATRVFR